jgi:hypothetical protein
VNSKLTKLYKTKQGIIVENENDFFRFDNEDWDAFTK